MFNLCRRGPASVCKFTRAVSISVTPITRPSTFTLAAKNSTRPAFSSRHFHISSAAREALASATAKSLSSILDGVDAGAKDGPAITTFQQLADKGLVHQSVISAITQGMGHQTMTEVQALTINETLNGTDLIAQARTGTGKTLGFLIPVVQNIIKNNPSLADPPRYSDRARPSDIRAIIMSPTRELAEQIAVEAKKVVRGTSLKVQVAVGGNSKSAMLRQMQREGCHLLVATPGRLHDLLSDPYSKVAAPDLSALVLDEADRLLDAGFMAEIQEIMDILPDRAIRDRQTLMFSATVPRDVMGLVQSTLKPDFQFVQTVREGEQATHEKVPQKIVEVRGFENLMPALVELCKREIVKSTASKTPAGEDVLPFKAIVYFSSTANVELAAEIFANLKQDDDKSLFGKHPLWPAFIFEMHGKLTQAERTRTSQSFRRAKYAIMFSSDVTARGMDFPGVTHVIQVGLPPNREQYIHRIGRTGRGDNPGEGWIFAVPVEMNEARQRLRRLPISRDDTLEASKVDMTKDAQLPASLAAILSQVGNATKLVGRNAKSAAFMASLGTMNSVSDKQSMIDLMNQWTRFGWGWDTPPAVSPVLAAKLGLSRVRGLNVGREPREFEEDRPERNSSHYGREDRERGQSRGGDFGRGFGDRGGRGGDRGGRGGDRGGRGAARAGGYGRDRNNPGWSFDSDKRGRSNFNDREGSSF